MSESEGVMSDCIHWDKCKLHIGYACSEFCYVAPRGDILNPVISQIVEILNKPETHDGFTYEHACRCIYDVVEDYQANKATDTDNEKAGA